MFKVSDVHVHLVSNTEKPREMLKEMDKNGVERAVIIGVYPGAKDLGELEQTTEARDPAITLENAKFLSKFCSAAPKRLIGFVWIEPRVPDAPSLAKKCLNMPHIRGVKMIPNHWYPYEERIFPVYASIQEEDAPMLFHSGILWGFMDSSRFCRPCFYEALLHFPKLRFALAHIAWPWTDECIAAAGRFRAFSRRTGKKEHQMWIDLTPGTPRFYRRDAIDKAYQYLGADWLLFGTDSLAGKGYNPYGKQVIDMDREILEKELKLDAGACEKIFHKNLDAYLGARKP